MNDKELLELAAKASGYQVHEWRGGRLYVWDMTKDSDIFPWSPLTDDGDALRLAMTLKLSIKYDEHGYVKVGSESHRLTSKETTCRAIVRAAAEIGRMK